MELTEQQLRVFDQIKAFMESDASVFILRGYAGTGKTTMVEVFANCLAQSRKIILMAPTGRAARLLARKTGYKASMVSSRKIEYELYVFGTDNLLEDLLEYIRPFYGEKVIYVGDPAQFPPVCESSSNALRADYFKERGLKVVEEELIAVLRQKGNSAILKKAMMI